MNKTKKRQKKAKLINITKRERKGIAIGIACIVIAIYIFITLSFRSTDFLAGYLFLFGVINIIENTKDYHSKEIIYGVKYD